MCVFFFLNFPQITGCDEGELALEDGDVIKLLSRVGNEWLKGELHGKEGIFPAAFVEVIEDLPEDQESSRDTDSMETLAIFDFEGQDGDLSFQVCLFCFLMCVSPQKWHGISILLL